MDLQPSDVLFILIVICLAIAIINGGGGGGGKRFVLWPALNGARS